MTDAAADPEDRVDQDHREREVGPVAAREERNDAHGEIGEADLELVGALVEADGLSDPTTEEDVGDACADARPSDEEDDGVGEEGLTPVILDAAGELDDGGADEQDDADEGQETPDDRPSAGSRGLDGAG